MNIYTCTQINKNVYACVCVCERERDGEGARVLFKIITHW